jgi:hypothetical protein
MQRPELSHSSRKSQRIDCRASEPGGIELGSTIARQITCPAFMSHFLLGKVRVF